MGVSKVVYGNTTIMDISGDTVTPNTLMNGITAHKADGTAIVGTAGAYVTGSVLHIPSSQASVNNSVLSLT